MECTLTAASRLGIRGGVKEQLLSRALEGKKAEGEGTLEINCRRSGSIQIFFFLVPPPLWFDSTGARQHEGI